MLNTLKELFEVANHGGQDVSPEEHEHALQLATAVMLAEVMRADEQVSASAREAAVTALKQKFKLSDTEVNTLIDGALEAAAEANDYYQFTSQINRGFDMRQRIRIIEYMWQVAYADGSLTAYENHTMRKVAELLYISHGDYIGAKMRAKEAAAEAGDTGLNASPNAT